MSGITIIRYGQDQIIGNYNKKQENRSV